MASRGMADRESWGQGVRTRREAFSQQPIKGYTLRVLPMRNDRTTVDDKSGDSRIALTPGKSRKLACLALVLAGLFAARNLSTWPIRLRYPGEESYIEGVPMTEMVSLRQGISIYSPPSPERFSAAIYGPLYYLLGARVVDPHAPRYLPFRLVSVAALLGCAAGCSIFAFWLGKSYLAAALAPLLFLSYDFVSWYGTSFRCNFIALFFFFAGFLVAYRFQNQRTILLAVPLMVLGAFFKQQFVAGPVAVVLFVLFEKRYRLAAEFAGLLALAGLGLLGLFQFVVFRGQAFLLHFLLFDMLSPSWNNFAACLAFFGIVLVVPSLGAFQFLRTNSNLLLRCYVGCAALLSLLTTLRQGSDINYFLEYALVLSAVFAGLLARRITTLRAPVWLLALALVLVLAQWRTYSLPGPADFLRDQTAQDYLRRRFPPQTLALGYDVGDLRRAGLETPISDLYQYTKLVRQGTFPDQGMVSQLQQRRFGLVTLTFDLEREKDPEIMDRYLNEPMRKAIITNYRLDSTLEMPAPEKLNPNDRLYFWVPRP